MNFKGKNNLSGCK